MPWPAVQGIFHQTLHNYVTFAREVLAMRPPVILTAGLTLIDGATFAVAGARADERPRFFERTASVRTTITDLAADPDPLLEPLWHALWDACGWEYVPSARHP